MKDADPTRDIAQGSNFNDWSVDEIRLAATLLADRTSILGKGVSYGDLIFGTKRDLIEIIERAQRRKAKKKLAKKKSAKKKTAKKKSTKKSAKKKQK
ncbi:MAG: hypothetical protein K1000chlam4_00904 [Chlamydiae bacterium]|nr:hypothetical protein [Chlamydiota bacterium]